MKERDLYNKVETLGPVNYFLPDRQASDVNHNQMTDRLHATIGQSTKLQDKNCQ